jgi:L-ascorbate metabolism protein UlaG (beta-lactamase superfamily)
MNRKSPIRQAAEGFDQRRDQDAKRVGLKPGKGWSGRRSFLFQVFLPSLFRRRVGAASKIPVTKVEGDGVIITWIGHASFLIQTSSGNILIDPIWAKWIKVVKRMRHPGLQPPDLPKIDLVLVTHAHYDHLDKKSLKAVAAGQPIIVPFAVGNLVNRLGFSEVRELNYWETFQFGGLKITLTPCYHWGARVLHDRHRGFGGFIIETPTKTVYHCGDSAYFNGFEEIGKRFDIDVALLPIGAYDPPSGREVHMTPEQAIVAFCELKAKHFIPMHYGSFPLSFEPLGEPLHRLQTKARLENLDLCVLEEGAPAFF